MLRRQAFKFELRPNGEQQRNLRRFAGACRFVFNKALALQQARWEQGEKKLGYADLCAALVTWKAQPETGWLSETPSQALQQSLKDLERAYRNFFEKRSAFPRFKKKGLSDHFRFPQGVKFDQPNQRLFLPKLGWLRFRNSREVLGTIKNVTVSQTAGKWFVSIQTEREVDVPVHPSASCVGIDVGIARFATFSDGSFIAPADSFRKHEQRLARYQRAMSRKVKFSNNWKKAKVRIQQLHHRIACVRRDFLHQASHQISQNHAMIVIEDLQISNMSKSAKGHAAAPGKNVRAKSGLNKAVLDQGWAEFRRQLVYKAEWTGGEVMAVDPRNTSRTCPACGHVSAENRQTQAQFRCVACGYAANADAVAALNILAAGHAALACQASDATMSPATGTRRSDYAGLALA